MGFVVVAWLVLSGVFMYQGIYTLRTGFSTWFFHTTPMARVPLGPLLRTWYGLVYLFPSTAMMVILATELKRVGVAPVWDWITRNLGMLYWSLGFMVVGFLLLVRPDKTLRWTLGSNPGVTENKSVQLIARVIGVAFIVGGLRVLALL